VTGTVAVRGLIVSSIMSKKLAAGADIIVLDVKCGSGGFMKTEADARLLAQEMVDVGNAAGRKTAAIITDMDEPLGHAIGNALEVKEAIATLKGEYSGELLELCLVLGSQILQLSGIAADEESARELLRKTITDGSALRKLEEFIEAQGGDMRCVADTSLLPTAPVQYEVKSEKECYVKHMNAEGIGVVSLHLGGGRATKDSKIDFSVGVVLNKKVGERVAAGETIATIHAADMDAAERGAAELLSFYEFSATQPVRPPFIKGKIM